MDAHLSAPRAFHSCCCLSWALRPPTNCSCSSARALFEKKKPSSLVPVRKPAHRARLGAVWEGEGEEGFDGPLRACLSRLCLREWGTPGAPGCEGRPVLGVGSGSDLGFRRV